MRVRRFGAILVLIGVSFFAKNVAAADLRVLAVGATAPTLKRVIPDFEKATNNKVIAWFGPPAPIVDMIAKGDTVDAVFISGPRYDDLVKGGAIETGFVIAKLGVGVGIPKGSQKPDINTPDALKSTLLAAKSIGGLASNNGSIGTETFIGFRKLGIEEQMVPKYHIYPNGISVVQALVKGEIEMGFSVVADMAATNEIDYAGPYPPGIQTYVSNRTRLQPPVACKDDPSEVAETGGAEPPIAEQSRSWRAAIGGREIMRGS